MILDKVMRPEINFRDLGGYQTEDGRVLRSGVFYRSSNLSRWNEQELHELARLNVHTILDLRTDYEVYEDPDPIPSDEMEYFRVSGMRDVNDAGVDYSPEGIRRMVHGDQDLSDHMKDLYLNMMFHNQAFEFLWILLQEGGHLPLLFHCATGKDRTGALSFLLLMALGIREDELMEDYLYSNVSFRSRIEHAFMDHEEELKKNPSLAHELQMENGVEESMGRAMLKKVKAEYADRNAFFLDQYGITEEQLTAFQNRFLNAKM